MSSVQRHQHPARLWVEDGRAECLVCGQPVIQDADGVRHAGEQPQRVAPAAADLPAVSEAVAAVAVALAGLPAGVSDTARAEAAVSALYERGALRRRPGSRPARGRDAVLFH